MKAGQVSIFVQFAARVNVIQDTRHRANVLLVVHQAVARNEQTLLLSERPSLAASSTANELQTTARSVCTAPATNCATSVRL